GHRAWVFVGRAADAGSRVPDISDLRPVRQTARGSDPARRGNATVASGNCRSAVDGASGGTRVEGRNRAPHRHPAKCRRRRDSDGRVIGIVLAFRDITNALRMQEERAKASKLASLGLLAGGIAHDFNDILMAILGNLSMARATTSRRTSSADWLAEAEQACV